MARKRKWVADFIKATVIHLRLLALLMVDGYLLFCLCTPLPTLVWTAEDAEVAGPDRRLFPLERPPVCPLC